MKFLVGTKIDQRIRIKENRNETNKLNGAALEENIPRQ